MYIVGIILIIYLAMDLYLSPLAIVLMSVLTAAMGLMVAKNWGTKVILWVPYETKETAEKRNSNFSLYLKINSHKHFAIAVGLLVWSVLNYFYQAGSIELEAYFMVMAAMALANAMYQYHLSEELKK